MGESAIEKNEYSQYPKRMRLGDVWLAHTHNGTHLPPIRRQAALGRAEPL